MNLLALKNEVMNDPTGKGYGACLPDAPGHVVDLLNAKTDSMVKALRSSTAMAWAATGPYSKIVDAANDPAHLCRASCLVIQDAFRAGQDIHIELSDMRAMFAAWIQTGIITQAQHDALIAMATQPASRAEVLGLGVVTEADIHAALGL